MGSTVDARDLPGRPCSIAATLRVVDGRWSLLIVRELALGNHRFSAIATNTGCSRDILTARLRQLESVGVVERVQYNAKPVQYEYHLTEAGRELLVVLTALRRWGDRWAVDSPPTDVTHTCGHTLEVVARCPECGIDVDPADPDSVAFRSLTPGWSRTGPVAEA